MQNHIVNGLSILKPKASPFPMARVGGDQDGAYLIPMDLEDVVACFSPGVNNFKVFEDELVQKYHIRCHMCDYSSDVEKFKTPIIEGMQTFQKKWLDIDGKDHSISLEDWVSELENDTDQDLILQMDIEGAEYRNLIHCPDSILSRFRIIVLELHELSMFVDIETFETKLYPLLTKLDQWFICIHAHPNNCCGEFLIEDLGFNVPNIIELTFLRRDRFEPTTALIPPQLPHPLDICANVPSKPPLFLNEKWIEGGIRSQESTIKMLEDKLKYYEGYKAKNIEDLDNNLKFAYQSISTLHTLCLNTFKKLYGRDFHFVNLQGTYNIAEEKTFVLGESYPGYPKQGVVKTKCPFFFHTALGINQFITIDLGQIYEMSLLVLVNRSDMCLERARCLFYVIHQSPEFEFLSGFPVNITEEFLRTNSSDTDIVKCVTPLMGLCGRYFSIFSPERTALHFQSISIFGKIASSSVNLSQKR